MCFCGWAWVDCSCAAFSSPAKSLKVRILYFSSYRGLEVLPFIEICKSGAAAALFLDISLSLAVCVRLYPSLSRSSLTEAFLQYILSPSQWMLCRARKVITRSSSLTPRGQIEPFVVHIKAITLPRGVWRGWGERGWLVGRQAAGPLSSAPSPRWQIAWCAAMMAFSWQCWHLYVYQRRCGEARVRATKHPVIWTETWCQAVHTWDLKLWNKK